MQEVVHVIGEVGGCGDDLAGKQRVGEDGESQLRHVVADIEDRAVLTLVFLRVKLGLSQHLRGKALGMARREDGGDGLARAAPDLAFGGEQPVAQDRPQHELAHHGHLVVGGIVDEQVLDEAGIVDDECLLADEARHDPGQRIGGLAPQLQRIAEDGADDLEFRRRHRARYRRRRFERLGTHIHGSFLPSAPVPQYGAQLGR